MQSITRTLCGQLGFQDRGGKWGVLRLDSTDVSRTHVWAPHASFQDASVRDQAVSSEAAGTGFVSPRPQLWTSLLVCLRQEPPGILPTVLRGMKGCFRSSTLFVGFDFYIIFHSFTFFTSFQNGTIYDFLLCRPYTPLQRQTTRTSLIPSTLIYSLFFQLPVSSVSHLTTHPVRSQKNCEDLESTKTQLFKLCYWIIDWKARCLECIKGLVKVYRDACVILGKNMCSLSNV